jgi:hypothetical protein
MACNAGGNIERIAFVWPPAIHSQGEILAVGRPITTRLLFIETRFFAAIVDGSLQSVCENHGVKHHVEVLSMKFIQDLLEIEKDM